jgi:hypothetical protein
MERPTRILNARSKAAAEVGVLGLAKLDARGVKTKIAIVLTNMAGVR